jgi:hypothetical protein
MSVIKFRGGSPLKANPAFDGGRTHALKAMEREMLGVDDTLRSRRILTLFFAFLSGISAVSTAVMPAILHI